MARERGRIKAWTARGFGFLVREQTGEEVFVHLSDLERGLNPVPRPGEWVTFQPDVTRKGLKARAVRFDADNQPA
jgi:cold shock CspA family protein